LEEEWSERVITRSRIQRETEDSGGEAGAFLTRGFFGAEFLVEEVANLFDEDGGKEFSRAISGEVNLTGVAAVAAPEAGHVGGGKCADNREEGKVEPTEGGELFEGGRPVQARAEDALQIGFCGGAKSPTGKRQQDLIQSGEGHALGEFRCRHDGLDFSIEKMFKKERRKWDFLAK
jgi:hypothetical protein